MPDDSPTTLSALDKLKEREAKLKAQIKAERAKIARQEAALHKRKCQIVGAAILAALESDPGLSDTLRPVLDTRITDPKERKMLRLDAPEPTTGAKEETPQELDPGADETIVENAAS